MQVALFVSHIVIEVTLIILLGDLLMYRTQFAIHAYEASPIKADYIM